MYILYTYYFIIIITILYSTHVIGGLNSKPYKYDRIIGIHIKLSIYWMDIMMEN